jgi:hypothetical protein
VSTWRTKADIFGGCNVIGVYMLFLKCPGCLYDCEVSHRFAGR